MQYFTDHTNTRIAQTLAITEDITRATTQAINLALTKGVALGETVATSPKTRETIRQTLYYLEYAFWAAAALCYNAGLMTRQTLDRHLDIWYQENRDDIEALQEVGEYMTTPVASAFIAHYLVNSPQVITATAKVTGGLKKAACRTLTFALSLTRNIREGMFPKV